MAAFTAAVDEQLSECGPVNNESLTEMYRSYYKAVFTAVQRNIRLKAVEMTGEDWKMQEIATVVGTRRA